MGKYCFGMLFWMIAFTACSDSGLDNGGLEGEGSNSSSSMQNALSSGSVVSSALSSSVSSETSPCGLATDCGLFTDDRDGEEYTWVQIDQFRWMSKNLNYNPESQEGCGQSIDSLDCSAWCYDNDPINCEKHGRLYTWAAALKLPNSCNYGGCPDSLNSDYQGICPVGWVIPDNSAWKNLEMALGMSASDADLESEEFRGDSVGAWLKDSSWVDQQKDPWHFSAQPAGAYDVGEFFYIGQTTWWWVLEVRDPGAKVRAVTQGYSGVRNWYSLLSNGVSLRCVQATE